MPRQSRSTHIHWNMLTIKCSIHVEHKVIIAGLDHLADESADWCVARLRENQDHVTVQRVLVPLDDAARIYKEHGLDYDDLPF